MFWNSTSVRTALKSSPPFGENAVPSLRHVTKYFPVGYARHIRLYLLVAFENTPSSSYLRDIEATGQFDPQSRVYNDVCKGQIEMGR
jgi:hypothetical protein